MDKLPLSLETDRIITYGAASSRAPAVGRRQRRPPPPGGCPPARRGGGGRARGGAPPPPATVKRPTYFSYRPIYCASASTCPSSARCNSDALTPAGSPSGATSSACNLKK